MRESEERALKLDIYILIYNYMYLYQGLCTKYIYPKKEERCFVPDLATI